MNQNQKISVILGISIVSVICFNYLYKNIGLNRNTDLNGDINEGFSSDRIDYSSGLEEDSEFDFSIENVEKQIMDHSDYIDEIRYKTRKDTSSHVKNVRPFLKNLVDKYKELQKIEVPISFNDYGNECINWSELGSDYRNNNNNYTLDVNNDGNYKCVISKKNSALTPSNQIIRGLQSSLNNYTNKNFTDDYVNAHLAIDNVIREYTKRIDDLIEIYKQKEDYIRQQKYLVKKNKNIVDLNEEKKEKLEDEVNDKIDNYEIDYQDVEKVLNKKEKVLQNIDNVKWYFKLGLAIYIFIILLHNLISFKFSDTSQL